jgi:hypothetical protein
MNIGMELTMKNLFVCLSLMYSVMAAADEAVGVVEPEVTATAATPVYTQSTTVVEVPLFTRACLTPWGVFPSALTRVDHICHTVAGGRILTGRAIATRGAVGTVISTVNVNNAGNPVCGLPPYAACAYGQAPTYGSLCRTNGHAIHANQNFEIGAHCELDFPGGVVEVGYIAP